MSTEAGGGNGFTNKEILLDLKKQMEEGFTRLEAKWDANEERIQNLERWRSFSKGSLAVISFLMPITIVISHYLLGG